MNTLTQRSLPILCLLAAIACYLFGIPAGGVVFLVLGIVFEGFFWTGILARRKAAKPPS